MAKTPPEKIAEQIRTNTVRRRMQRRGLQLVHSRRRDPLAWDYGFTVLRADGTPVWTTPDGRPQYAESLDVVEAWLDDPDRLAERRGFRRKRAADTPARAVVVDGPGIGPGEEGTVMVTLLLRCRQCGEFVRVDNIERWGLLDQDCPAKCKGCGAEYSAGLRFTPVRVGA